MLFFLSWRNIASKTQTIVKPKGHLKGELVMRIDKIIWRFFDCIMNGGMMVIGIIGLQVLYGVDINSALLLLLTFIWIVHAFATIVTLIQLITGIYQRIRLSMVIDDLVRNGVISLDKIKEEMKDEG